VAEARRLRVLQVGKYYPPHRGGMETQVATLCTALRSVVDLRVVVANDGRRTVRETVDGVDVTRLGAPLTVGSSALCPGLRSEIRRIADDVVHLHLPNPVVVAAFLASGHRGRLVATYHSNVVRQRVLGALTEPLLQAALARCAAILVSSQRLLDHAPSLRRHADRCRVVPFGVSAESLVADPAAVARIRAEHGPRLVLAVGRLVYYKGFDHLVRAMRDVDGRLVIVGDGPWRGRLEREVGRLGLEGRVRLLGTVSDVAPYHRAADVFVLPSVAASETFGLAQLEAMTCGRPVINTDLPTGVPTVSIHEQTGLTVPPGDEAALASAITRLLDDGRLRQQLGAAAAERAARVFPLERMVGGTLAAYAGTA
jgi:glycosyltransferase involved in cell wall biosynthesis